jgi:zinc transport system substrate-binding protein
MGNSVLAGKKVVRAADYVNLLPAQYDEEGAPAADGAIDPHIWLDPVNAQAIVTGICTAVSEIDPDNANFYADNANAYNAQLDALHNDFAAAFASATSREIITSHAAFGYLANRYGLKQVAIMGLTPDAEPTPERMAQIINHVRNNGIKYIFFETLVSPKLSEVIAAESGAQTLVLNPIEGLTDQEIAQGEDYISVMRMNLQNLKYALGVVD